MIIPNETGYRGPLFKNKVNGDPLTGYQIRSLLKLYYSEDNGHLKGCIELVIGGCLRILDLSDKHLDRWIPDLEGRISEQKTLNTIDVVEEYGHTTTLMPTDRGYIVCH